MPVLAQVDLGDSVENAVDSAIDVLPQVLLFIIILIVGFIVARMLASLLDTILEKVGFDRWVERGGVKRALANTPYDASDFLSKLVYYALVLFTLQLAFGVFGDNPISDLLEGLIAYLPNIFAAVLILVIAAYVASAVRDIAGAALSNAEFGGLLTKLAYWAIIVVGVFAALDQLEIAPTIVTGLFYALLAIVAGSAIVAIGGGGIQPMRSRWEAFLDRAEDEAKAVRSDNDGAAVTTDAPSTSNEPGGRRRPPATPPAPRS